MLRAVDTISKGKLLAFRYDTPNTQKQKNKELEKGEIFIDMRCCNEECSHAVHEAHCYTVKNIRNTS